MKKNINLSLLVGLLTFGCLHVETLAMDASDFEHVGRTSLQQLPSNHAPEILENISNSLKINNILAQEEIGSSYWSSASNIYSWTPNWVDRKVIAATFVIGGAAAWGYYYYYLPRKERIDFEQLIKENISTPCKEIIKREININTPNTAENLRRTFQDIHDHIQNQTFASESFSENLGKLITSLEDCDDQLFREIREGLRNINERSNRRELKNKFFEHLCKYLSDFSEKPIYKKIGSSATLKGSIVGTSDLVKEREQDPERLWEINVYSKHTLLIDQDLAEPGINVSFLAPHWIVMGKHKLILKGNDGAPHDKLAQNGVGFKGDKRTGEDGEDGCHGFPGESAGYFYGQGEEFFDLESQTSNALNLRSLTIDVSGGEGGAGQNGGNGANGKDEEAGDENKVRRRYDCRISMATVGEESAFVGNFYKFINFFSFFETKTFREIYESGKRGGQGGDAGKGGKGGFPGRKASVRIVNTKEKNIEILPVIIADEKPGTDGEHGSPGEGGKYCIYGGTYLRVEPQTNSTLQLLGGSALFFVSYKVLGLREAAIITPCAFGLKWLVSSFSAKQQSGWEKRDGEDIQTRNTPIPGKLANEHNAERMVRNEPKIPIVIQAISRDYEDFLKLGE